MELCYLMVIISAFCYQVDAYGHGAPFSTCFTQYPKHNHQGGQQSESPFNFKFTPLKYQPGQEVMVELVSTNGLELMGIQTAARRVSGNMEEIVGTFVQFPTDKIQAFNCYNGLQNMITHRNKLPTKTLTFKWKAPEDNVGDVKFITTFLKGFDTFWYGVESILPVDSTTPIQGPANPAIPVSTLTTAIDFDGCGDTKGCFYYPKLCLGSDCLAAASYQHRPATKDFLFELHTKGHADYISIGFSDDRVMGKDATITCTGRNSKMSVQEGFNPAYYNVRNINLFSKNLEVNYIDGKLRCRFVVPEKFNLYHVNPLTNGTVVSESVWDLQKDWYLMLAWGHTMPDSNVIAHHHDLPTTTMSKVDLRERSIVYGSAFHILVTVHGCMMLIAWILLTGLVTVIARHYKDWMPGTKVLGTKVWFQVHRGLAILVFVMTAIGLILVFSHFGTEKLSEPGYDHACVGIATMTAVGLQIVAGILRPDNDHSMRPLFNWGHWFTGHVTHILAAATLFLAFDMKHTNPDLHRQGFIVLAVWVGVQILWYIVFEVINRRRGNTQDDPLESKSGVHSFNISDGRAEKDGSKDVILLCIYASTLVALCVSGLAIFLLY